MKKTMRKLLMGLMLSTISSAAALAGPSGIAWRDWSDEAFAAARSGKRMGLDSLRKDLVDLLSQRYDRELGGWGFSKKYLDWDGVEYCIEQARAGDVGAERMAKQTLAAARTLIDPVWGGLYQYSDSGDWKHPHFEKLAQFQAEGMRVFALAYALWRDPADLAAARDSHRYARAFLTSPEGASHVSQDADLVSGEQAAAYYALDDAGRRSRDVPRVDTHVYARETAWMANALVGLNAATADPAIREQARAAGGGSSPAARCRAAGVFATTRPTRRAHTWGTRPRRDAPSSPFVCGARRSRVTPPGG